MNSDRKPRALRPGVNSLESRLLLSATASEKPGAAEVSNLTGHVASADASNRVSTLRGNYAASHDNRVADEPLRVNLAGLGKVRGLGRVRSQGSLVLGGFLVAGSPDIRGEVTLTNARGSVTLRFTGMGGNIPLPNARLTTTLSVVSGTGAFTNFRRIGTAKIDFGPNTATSTDSPVMTTTRGTMTMRLELELPVR